MSRDILRILRTRTQGSNPFFPDMKVILIRRRKIIGIPFSIGSNVAGAAKSPDLTGIQRSTAGTIDAMCSSSFPNGKQSLDLGMPPGIYSDTTVVMLGTESNL